MCSVPHFVACVGHHHSQNDLALALDDLLMMCEAVPACKPYIGISAVSHNLRSVLRPALIVRWASRYHVGVLARLADRCDDPDETPAAGVQSTVVVDKRGVVIALTSRCEASRRRSCLSRFRHRDSPTGTLHCLEHRQKPCLVMWISHIVHARCRHTAALKAPKLRSDRSGTAEESDVV